MRTSEIMTVQELRDLFISYFAERGHLVQPSAPLVLRDDPTSLFTSAGMQPYMAAFRGEEEPPAPCAVSIQKILRTNDIEGVGFHNRYCTFFEMMGNFSFSDYLKEGAIELAWDFVTNVLRLPQEDLYVTVHTDDDEAEGIWHEKIGVPMERISRLGRSDNWWPKERWEGPCGPCSEIHLDLGAELGCDRPDCTVGCDCDRYLELWNLVFQMYTEAEDGTLTPLPSAGIDTGLGLERLALVMQDVRYIAETDEMAAIMQRIVEVINEQTGSEYAYGGDGHRDLALRIMTDHVRGAALVLAEGVAPSNEGAGYVLRRLIRRAFRFGRQFGAGEPFLYQAIPAVTAAMGQQYPELAEREEFSTELVQREEERFGSTLRQGMSLFEQIALELRQADEDTVPGEKAFTLYDTYGFPVELTVEMAAERDLKVDMEGFEAAMEAQRARSGRGAGLATAEETISLAHLPATEFVGHDTDSSTARILAIVVDGEETELAKAEAEAMVILDATPFYAEQGGQVGDEGIIHGPKFEFAVENAVKHGDKVLHVGTLKRGAMAVGDEVSAGVDTARRRAIMRNHTGTHLLHAALRKVVGEHVSQSGSLVAADRLRFDFTHHEAVTPEQLAEVEEICNEWVLENRAVSVAEMEYEEALAQGAIAIFTEKYDQQVRTVTCEGLSMELCGGTHVRRTGEVGSLHVIAESSVAAGIRRIEAVTGLAAVEHHRQLAEQMHELSGELNCPADQISGRIAQLRQQIGDLHKQVEEARTASAAVDLQSLVDGAEDVEGLKLVAAVLPGASKETLPGVADELVGKLGVDVTVLFSKEDGKGRLVCKASPAAMEAGVHAGKLAGELAQRCGGGAGGRPHFAEGAAKDTERMDEAVAAAGEALKAQLEEKSS